MSDNKQTGFFAGKGYYIALILCAAAIGITGYVYSRNSREAAPVSVQETQPEVVAGTMGSADIPVIATQPPVTVPAPSTQPTTPAPTEKQPLKTAAPIAGETIFGYAMETLSYNQTTRDWRVHNGIDLAAEPGTPVCAAAEGKVYSVYEDESLGYTVVIQHRDGYTTRYSSLSENVAVQTGETVTLGQTIGYAGDTALVETALGTHVHFSVTCYDAPMDPAEFLALGQ